MAAWTLAPLAIYLPIHTGEYGYVFSMIPALTVIAARGAIALARGLRMPRTLPAIVGAVVLANAAIFLLSDTPLSATDVVRRDRGTMEKLAYLRTSHDLARATIIAAYDALVAERYADDDHVLLGYDPATPPFEFVHGVIECGPGLGPLQRCSRAALIAVWDDLIRVRGSGWETVTMPHGAKLRVARDVKGVRVRIAGLKVSLDR